MGRPSAHGPAHGPRGPLDRWIRATQHLTNPKLSRVLKAGATLAASAAMAASLWLCYEGNQRGAHIIPFPGKVGRALAWNEPEGPGPMGTRDLGPWAHD